MIVATRGPSLGLTHELSLREIARTSRLVSMLTGYVVQPNKAVVGANAFAHESGIHQHGVLSNRETYEIMDPAEIGLDGSRIVLGKHSGRHAFAEALVKLGMELERDVLDRTFARFKDLADRKLSLTDADLAALVADELGVTDDAFVLESLAVTGGTHLSPTATVRLRRGDEVVEDSAMGDGMIDAACGAIGRATGVAARLGAVRGVLGHAGHRRARRRRGPARGGRSSRHRPRPGGRRGRGERPRLPLGDQPCARGPGRRAGRDSGWPHHHREDPGPRGGGGERPAGRPDHGGGRPGHGERRHRAGGHRPIPRARAGTRLGSREGGAGAVALRPGEGHRLGEARHDDARLRPRAGDRALLRARARRDRAHPAPGAGPGAAGAGDHRGRLALVHVRGARGVLHRRRIDRPGRRAGHRPDLAARPRVGEVRLHRPSGTLGDRQGRDPVGDRTGRGRRLRVSGHGAHGAGARAAVDGLIGSR